MICGIDTGARRIAYCLLPEDAPARFGWYETPQTTAGEELEDLYWWFTHQMARWAGLDVWLEKVVAPHGRVTSLDGLSRHSMTIGMVLATVGGEIITPATWKASILGHGHADKDDTREWVQYTSPQVAAAVEASATTKDRRADLYDAYCIALHGDLARRHPGGVDPGRSVPRRRSRARAG